MGLIAGIIFKKYQDDLSGRLMGMFDCQRHRDNSEKEYLLKGPLAIGMVNRHNMIFYGLKSPEHEIRKKNNEADIYAYVDGVVLDAATKKIDLENMGVIVDAPSCSAIIVAAYKKWGLDFMRHLEGEFACALWDNDKEMLILARDPYGHKPLHYYHDNNQFIF
jgi:asparagine synthase (glutamine-hydrolysing)